MDEVIKESKEQALKAADWITSVMHRIYSEGFEQGFRAGVMWLRGKDDGM